MSVVTFHKVTRDFSVHKSGVGNDNLASRVGYLQDAPEALIIDAVEINKTRLIRSTPCIIVSSQHNQPSTLPDADVLAPLRDPVSNDE